MRMNIAQTVESSTHSTREEVVTGQNVHNVSVAESIADGSKLQQKKSKGQPKERTVNIISEKNAKRNCSRQHSPLGKRRKSATQIQNRRKNEVHPRSTAGNTSNNFHSEKSRRCPLRIAELAEPSKRHCIETWRQRSNILPEFMLERLKRQVMNQKVIARIPDAVECFKIKPPKKKSLCAQKCVQPVKKHAVDECTITQARNLSAVFAHHIAIRLIENKLTCPKLTTGRLKILSDVVANEIHNELFSKKKTYPDYCYDTTVLEDMSMKITMWILSILKDSEEKLIEDQLRAKKCEQNRLNDDDSLVTLINTYFQTAKKNSKDMYEEDGPALDALDSLISNVLNICVPKTRTPDHPKSISNTSTDGSNSEEANTIQANSDDIYNAENVNIISDAANVEYKEAFEKIDLHIDQDDMDDETTISGSKYESIPDDDVDMLTRNVDDEEVNINVSGVLVALEESLDERRKVKFTNLNDPGAGELAGGQGEGGRESNGGWDSSSWGLSGWGQIGYGGTGGIGRSEPGIKHAFQIGKRKEEGYHSFDSPSPRLKKDLSEISFRPPNDSLLSVADEYWPNDLSYASLKLSASMSKSITSLAHIQEKEEYYDSKETESASIENEGNFVHYSSIKETAGISKSDTSSTFKILNDVLSVDNNKESNVEDLNEERNVQHVVEYLSQHPSEENTACNEDTCYKNAGKGDHLTTTDHIDNRSNSDKSIILKTVKQKFKKTHDDKSKLDYRVYLQNAPSWACSNASSPSTLSPSNESIQSVRICKKKMAKCELRRWCVDMEQTVGNLEEWNRWLDLTCKKVLIMKQQSEVDNIFSNEDRSNDLKEWIKLKKSLDKDAVLWKKLTDRTLEVLKNYYDPYGPLIENDMLSSVIPKKKLKRQSLMDTLYTIEGLSLWLHRSIVSTENCVKCNCSNFIKKPRTSRESMSGNQPSCSTSIYYEYNRHENL